MAKRELHSEIEINEAPARVWQVLTDFAAYPEWNPFLVEMGGTPVKNAKLRVCFQPPGGKKIQMRPLVKVAEPNKELRWIGRVWFAGIFDGEHSLLLEPLDGGKRTRFVQHENFSGVTVGLFKKTLERTQQGFDEMNAALKKRAEGP